MLLYTAKQHTSRLQALCNLDKPGRSLAKVQNQMENKTLKHVQLSENAAKIHLQQFLQAVVDNLKGRFPDDDLVQMLQPLESTNWPEEDHKVLLKLAKLLSLPVSNAVEEFRTWKQTAMVTGHTLKRILCATKTYNCSSAECERGFSAANNTVTLMRN